MPKSRRFSVDKDWFIFVSDLINDSTKTIIGACVPKPDASLLVLRDRYIHVMHVSLNLRWDRSNRRIGLLLALSISVLNIGSPEFASWRADLSSYQFN